MAKREPKDPRSTQRKRARQILFRSGEPYVCNHCGKSPKELPKDAPRNLELAPIHLRTVSSLQANHINKDIMDNDLVNLEWLCPSCHKIADSKTEKGVSPVEPDLDYGIELLDLLE